MAAACGGDGTALDTSAVAPESSAPALGSGVYQDNMDLGVAPGDDFFAYVNGTWLKETEIPADEARYGVIRILRDKSQENVRNIIEESAQGDFAEGTPEQKVGDLFASYTDMDTRDALGLEPLKPEFDRIDSLASKDDLAVYFAEANKLGISLPFQLLQYFDFQDPNTYMMYTWQGGLGLPEREYYLQEDEKSAEIRTAYLAHLEKMLGIAGVENPADAAAMIMALETRMAEQHMAKELTRNRNLLYNKFPLDELDELLPDFNWDGYIAEAGIGEIDGLVVTQVDHMKAMASIIDETPLDDWKTYLKWQALNASTSRLNDAVDKANFDFYSRTLNGIEEPQPLWRRGVNNVNAVLGEAVGRIYVQRHFPPEAKARMEELVQNLIDAYEVSIRSLDWMGEETRAAALDKLSKFTPKIGYPDEWRDYSAITIRPDDLYGNMQRASIAEYERQLERQGKPVDRSEWAMTPQTVNAYYNPSLNEIVFPAGILQPPFFDMTVDDATNYGSIGAVIGHEIGHGFDDAGSAFDGDGVLRNWWTDEDKAKFKALTADLVEQYNGYKPFDDLSLNGAFTLGENIGDLGGLGIAVLAYQMSLDGRVPPVLDGYTGMQRVFIGYAQSWLRKTRDEALRTQIATDPHSPARYRTNGVVRNIDAFYDAFDVGPEHALYLPPEERVKIW